MPFHTTAKREIEKLGGLKRDIIAPSHGSILKNTDRILNTYNNWVIERQKRKATSLSICVE